MKILIVPDSFKGSLSSDMVCNAIEEGLLKADSSLQITKVPFSDGGEGFCKSMSYTCKGNTLYTRCHNIYNQIIKAPVFTFGTTAVIECAAASGLLSKRNVMKASSYGTGELIRFAVSQGFSNIILGLGGTGCCDGGAGALCALGADFYDESFRKIVFPRGEDLNYIFGFSAKNIVKDISFTYATDVDNEFFGENGAAYIFAPQKGTNGQQVKELDDGLKRLNAFFNNDISKVKGAGAAGGICGGLYSVYGGAIESGFNILSRYSKLEDKIKESDLIITGEGKTDSQTLMGKLPYRICTLAEKHSKKVAVISGSIESVKLSDTQISLVDEKITTEYAIDNAYKLLVEKSKYILQ